VPCAVYPTVRDTLDTGHARNAVYGVNVQGGTAEVGAWLVPVRPSEWDKALSWTKALPESCDAANLPGWRWVRSPGPGTKQTAAYRMVGPDGEKSTYLVTGVSRNLIYFFIVNPPPDADDLSLANQAVKSAFVKADRNACSDFIAPVCAS
jgi:hypothetical protein